MGDNREVIVEGYNDNREVQKYFIPHISAGRINMNLRD